MYIKLEYVTLKVKHAVVILQSQYKFHSRPGGIIRIKSVIQQNAWLEYLNLKIRGE
jgi:hypothetical protein